MCYLCQCSLNATLNQHDSQPSKPVKYRKLGQVFVDTLDVCIATCKPFFAHLIVVWH